MKRIAFLLLLCFTGCAKPSNSAPTPDAPVKTDVAASADASSTEIALAPAAPEVASDVKLQILDFEGIQKLVASHQGKVVVMDAWSTSCPPCMEEFPHLVELHKKYGPDKVACVSLSFDFEGIGKPEEQIEPVLAFLKKHCATFDNVLSNEESDVLYRKFDLGSIPAVFVYEPSGKLSKRFDNQKAKKKEDAFTYKQIGEHVAGLLGEK